jgi:hypothetical protein
MDMIQCKMQKEKMLRSLRLCVNFIEPFFNFEFLIDL